MSHASRWRNHLFIIYFVIEIKHISRKPKPVLVVEDPPMADSSYSSSDEAKSNHYADQESTDETPKKTEILIAPTKPPNARKPEVELPVPKKNSYNAEEEIKSRRKSWLKACEGRRRSLMNLSYRSNLVSRWGVSTGNVNFFTCFLPKAASSSMSAAMLLATGWINKLQKNEITDEMWDNGRNHCSRFEKY